MLGATIYAQNGIGIFRFVDIPVIKENDRYSTLCFPALKIRNESKSLNCAGSPARKSGRFFLLALSPTLLHGQTDLPPSCC
jgi:hypothetical protein